ncbi:MAG: trehalose-phosphatase [Jatrophihabitantaceae bacterium]
MDLAELVTAVQADLPNALIALDFDGTLAPIVRDPADSRPVAGTLEVLTDLAGRGARIAIVTGRDALTVLSLSGLESVPGLIVEGLYGAESWRGGALTTPPTPAAIQALRERLPAIVAGGVDDRVWIEDKRLSLVVHGRLADDPEAALDPLRAPVAAVGAEIGFDVHAGRGVIELRLPGFDKAGALRRLIMQASAKVVLFAGDDVGDLPAFAVIDELRSAGAAAWAVGVASPEVPELAGAVDVLVDGPGGVLQLLERIAGL